MSFFSQLGKAIGGAINNIVHDPIPTLVGVGLMSIGVPPIYAGAASGAVGAAEHGGDILKGAVTGGALGYVGETTSTYLSGTGASPIVVGAGTGATLGVAGSALNGGKSMGLNALTGGIIGGFTGYYASKSGSTTYSYDDGSTITKYPDGTTTATPANTVSAPVSDVNPPPAGITDAGTASKAIIANTSEAALTNTGLVNSETANVLASNGYTPTDVQNLISKGYNASDLANMASTGVPASTLTSLANSSFQESTINDLLTNHNVSANDIATASDLVKSGKMYTNSAISLLKEGVSTSMLNDFASKGQGIADQASYLLDKGVNANTVKSMVDNNINLGDVNYKLEQGKVTNTQLNNSSNVNDILNPQPVKPTVAPTTQATAPVVPEPLGSNIPDYAIKASYLGKDVYFDPVNGYVFNHDGSLNIDAERMADIDTNNIGVKTADASKVVNQVTHPNQPVVSDTNTSAPFKVDVSGAPANANFNPHNVVAPEGYRLATMDEINSGAAGDSAHALGNNELAWLVPVSNVNVPNVTVTPPNASQPSNLQVAHVTVNPTDLINPVIPTQPVVNVPNIPLVNNTPVINNTTVTKKEEPPLTPLTPVTLNSDDRKVTPVVVNPPVTPPVVTPPDIVEPKTPEVIPYNPPAPPVTPPVVNVPNPPIVTEPPATPTDNTHYGTYTWGNAPQVKIPTGLNPGYIMPGTHYQTTNPAQSQYYWGSHPYQPGPTFNNELYNTVPNAPLVPWGVGHAQTSATPAQILAAMQGLYPNLGTQTVTGPAIPT